MEKITFNYTKYVDRNPLQKFLIRNFLKTFLKLAKSVNPKKILDVGCGEGIILNKLRKEKIGKKIQGIDYSKDAVALARNLYPWLTVKKADIYRLPYKSNSFDLLTATEVLEHLENPKKALTEMKRVTSRYLILSVPNEPIFQFVNFLRGRYLSRLGNTPGHIHHWTTKKFKAFVEKEGFQVVSLKNPFPWTLVLLEKNKT